MNLRLLPAYWRRWGVLRGYRFWRLAQKCEHDPGMMLEWAEECQQEASRLLKHGHYLESGALLAWAETLRTQYNKMHMIPVRQPILKRYQRKSAKRIQGNGSS